MNIRSKSLLYAAFLGIFISIGGLANDFSLDNKQNIKILLPGKYHGDEIDIENNSIVYGIYSSELGDGYELKKHSVSVSLFEDLLNDKNGQKTGKQVEISPKSTDNLEPIILINAPFLNDATVAGGRKILHKIDFNKSNCLYTPPEGYISSPGSEINTSKECDVSLGRTSYNLKTQRIFEVHDNFDSKLRFNHKIMITGLASNNSSTSQILENVSDIAWAGDLDSDGKLDLLINMKSHYNSIHYYKLYLSSLAGDQNLLGEAAEFNAAGC